jgi:hypothetical protein
MVISTNDVYSDYEKHYMSNIISEHVRREGNDAIPIFRKNRVESL